MTANHAGETEPTRIQALRDAVFKMPNKPTVPSLAALERLSGYPTRGGDSANLLKSKLGAVLVLVCIDKAGEIQILLTTRSQNLRSHPGETAFPGGRHEADDPSVEATALREAYEECGIDTSLEAFKAFHLTTLEPVIARTRLFIVPCVYLLLSSFEEALANMRPSPTEVASIFYTPLDIYKSVPDDASEFKYTYVDVELDWLPGNLYRLNTLNHPSFHSKVWGMTFDVLNMTARIAYDIQSEDPFRAATQLPHAGHIEAASKIYA